MDFKTGDRIIVIDKDHNFYGLKGIVYNLEDCMGDIVYRLTFDKGSIGKRGNRVSYGALYGKRLELEEKKPLTARESLMF